MDEIARPQARPPSLADTVRLIGAAIGCGAPDEACAEAPFALRDGGLAEVLREGGLAAQWGAIHLAPTRRDGCAPLPAVADLGRRIAADVAALTAERRRFVGFGGDHTAAIGIWSGAARGLRWRGGRLGLVWVDAHMDAHTFATTPSRMIHGMPVACLLGHGEPALTAIAGDTPAVAPEHLCLIGARSWEEGEAELLRRLGVRVIMMDEVRRRGFVDCFAEGRAIAGAGTAGFGVSLDIDAFDPKDAPGTGLPTEHGIRAAELLPAFAGLAACPGFVGMEVAEYNPRKDAGGVTAALIRDVVAATYRAPEPELGRPVV